MITSQPTVQGAYEERHRNQERVAVRPSLLQERLEDASNRKMARVKGLYGITLLETTTYSFAITKYGFMTLPTN